MASSNHSHFCCAFRNWMAQQQQDFHKLLAADPAATSPQELEHLRDKCTKHFKEYAERRAAMARQDAPCLLSPPWCSAFENAFMWVGGCRPSLFIRLIYCVCGSELDGSNLAVLSARQLEMISALQCKTVKEEDKFSTRIASLKAHEEIADEPLATMAKKSVGEVEAAMAAHEAAMAEVICEADKLRMETLKEVMGILSPLQAVDLLIAAKQLHAANLQQRW
ncbi:protein DELAY OF GERMINATION 1-like [Salvia splendens]|uniref:protein DELAY OF GERMINATION 1-like n=1 Tax=Salvia splendens TaxID=180675 RepID=UPI001100A7D4|nr:protein DELAY OF GERMINATION 1-like [Salvia splendens]